MPKPVYALVGGESFLQLEALQRIIGQFPADVQRVDFDGERAELDQVLDELRSFAMFASAKVVVVRDADAFVTRFRESLEKYLAQGDGAGTLVLRMSSLPKNQRIYKSIAKAGQIEPCDAPKPAELPGWIINRAKTAHQATIAPDAARLLAELIGGEMGRLDSEIAKLAVMSDNAKIDAKQVKQGVAFQREQEIWDMTNELAAGRIDQALRRWRQLVQMDSSAEFRAVTWLGIWLEKVTQAIDMLDQGISNFDIARALKIWPSQMQEPFIKTAKKLGMAGVERAVDMLVEVDFQSKTGVGEAATNVERFLLAVGNMVA